MGSGWKSRYEEAAEREATKESVKRILDAADIEPTSSDDFTPPDVAELRTKLTAAEEKVKRLEGFVEDVRWAWEEGLLCKVEIDELLTKHGLEQTND